jgi:hypothetical protein
MSSAYFGPSVSFLFFMLLTSFIFSYRRRFDDDHGTKTEGEGRITVPRSTGKQPKTLTSLGPSVSFFLFFAFLLLLTTYYYTRLGTTTRDRAARSITWSQLRDSVAVPHYFLNDKVVFHNRYNRLRVYGHHHSTHPLTTSIPQWDDGWGGSDDNNGPNDVVWAMGKFFFFLRVFIHAN